MTQQTVSCLPTAKQTTKMKINFRTFFYLDQMVPQTYHMRCDTSEFVYKACENVFRARPCPEKLNQHNKGNREMKMRMNWEASKYLLNFGPGEFPGERLVTNCAILRKVLRYI